MRCAQTAPPVAGAVGEESMAASRHAATPRQLYRLAGRRLVATFGSWRHSSRPLPGSSATISLNGVHRTSLSSTRIGVVWNLMRFISAGSRRASSPVR